MDEIMESCLKCGKQTKENYCETCEDERTVKTYQFEVTTTVEIEVDANDEDEAREGIAQALSKYFAGTEREFSEDEAKLLEVAE